MDYGLTLSSRVRVYGHRYILLQSSLLVLRNHKLDPASSLTELLRKAICFTFESNKIEYFRGQKFHWTLGQ